MDVPSHYFGLRLMYVILGLHQHRLENTHSGRLVGSGNEWNLHGTLILWPFETNPRYLQVWKSAPAFGPLFGILLVYVLNSMEVERGIIISASLFTLGGLVMVFAVGTHIGLAIQLIIWSWQRNEAIRLVSNKK